MERGTVTRPTNVHDALYTRAYLLAKSMRKSKKWMLESSMVLFMRANVRKKKPTHTRPYRYVDEGLVRPQKVDKRQYLKAKDLARRHGLTEQEMMEEGMAIFIQIYSRNTRRRT